MIATPYSRSSVRALLRSIRDGKASRPDDRAALIDAVRVIDRSPCLSLEAIREGASCLLNDRFAIRRLVRVMNERRPLLQARRRYEAQKPETANPKHSARKPQSRLETIMPGFSFAEAAAQMERSGRESGLSRLCAALEAGRREMEADPRYVDPERIGDLLKRILVPPLAEDEIEIPA